MPLWYCSLHREMSGFSRCARQGFVMYPLLEQVLAVCLEAQQHAGSVPHLVGIHDAACGSDMQGPCFLQLPHRAVKNPDCHWR